MFIRRKAYRGNIHRKKGQKSWQRDGVQMLVGRNIYGKTLFREKGSKQKENLCHCHDSYFEATNDYCWISIFTPPAQRENQKQI